MPTTVGIIAAKKNSNRFKNKNIHELEGKPLFWHSVEPLLKSKNVNDVYVATDSEFITNYCLERNVNVIKRTCNSNHDEAPLLSVLKFAYQNIDVRYDNIITIMANCPFHTSQDVDKAIDMINTGKYNEIRSFNQHGDENGLIVFREHVILNYYQISSYMGSITTLGEEIHFLEELEQLTDKKV
jgi:CMP-N-acetylneuraminic acid synthetase